MDKNAGKLKFGSLVSKYVLVSIKRKSGTDFSPPFPGIRMHASKSLGMLADCDHFDQMKVYIESIVAYFSELKETHKRIRANLSKIKRLEVPEVLSTMTRREKKECSGNEAERFST